LGTGLVPFLDVIDLNFGLKNRKNSFFVIPTKCNVDKGGSIVVSRHTRNGKDPSAHGCNKTDSCIQSETLYLLYRRSASNKFLIHITTRSRLSLPLTSNGEKKGDFISHQAVKHTIPTGSICRNSVPRILFSSAYGPADVVPVNRGQLLFSDNFFIGYAKDQMYVKPCAAYFNSTLHLFFSEIWDAQVSGRFTDILRARL